MKNLVTLLLKRIEIDDKRWNSFIDSSPQACVFAYTWYLDSICKNWFAIVVKNGANEWLAAMPIPVYTKLGMQRCYMPIFCQHLAIFFRTFDSKEEKQLALKKRIIIKFINNFPSDIKIFKYNISANNKYLLPFYWSGFDLKLRYTFHINIDQNKQVNYYKFSHKARTAINKAIKNNIICENCTSIEQIVKVGKETINVNFDEEALYNLWKKLKPKNMINAVKATNQNQTFHAGIIYLIYRNKYIYLFGAADKNLNQFGAMSLLIWHIIKNTQNEITHHNFQGSMIESIEKFYRSFGAFPVPYYQVFKNNLSFPVKSLHYFYTKAKLKLYSNV